MSAKQLSPAAPRTLLHTRKIECNGYEREDGLFDIEAHMTDTKAYSFTNRNHGAIAAGQPVHDMWLRITVDEQLEIHAAEAVTAASPYPVCPAITERYQLLVGVRIGAGWRQEIKSRLGGIKGCTHLSELLGPLATTAFQTLVARRRSKPAPVDQRPVVLNTCHAYDSAGPIVQDAWPQFFTGAADGGAVKPE